MTDNSPTKLICPACGAPLDFDGTSSIVHCKFCKTIAYVPGLSTGQGTTSSASLDEVHRLLQNGNLDEAVRLFSHLSGADSNEARELMDALASGKEIEVRRGISGLPNAEETSRTMEEVKNLLRAGDKIGAIKHYREVYGVGLTKAKEVVDQVEATLTGIPVPAQPNIPGSPSTASRHRNRFGCVLGILILVFIGAILTFFLIRLGVFNPTLTPLNAAGPFKLVVSGTEAPPDITGLFYDVGKDVRMVGLVNGSTGRLGWRASPLAGDGFADAILASGDLVYAATGTTLLAYHRSDGSLAWQTQMPDKLNYGDTPMLLTAGRVITLNTNETLQAYDAATGSLIWNRQLVGYDDTLRLMNGSLIVLDYVGGSHDYSLIYLNPVDGSQQLTFTPSCKIDEYSSDTLYLYAGLVYEQAENALYLVYDASVGCIQRLDFSTGQVTWQTISQDGFSFSSDGFPSLMTDKTLFFNTGNLLMAVDKSTGAVQTLLSNQDYEFIPLAVSGDTLLVRARRTRGTEQFELWGVDSSTGKLLWQNILPNATPIDPPNEMVGLVDNTEAGWTWRLLPAGLMLIKFQAVPNQITLQTIDPASGNMLGEKIVPLKLISGDFYPVPTVIGWRDPVVYLEVDSKLYALDISTGKVLFHY